METITIKTESGEEYQVDIHKNEYGMWVAVEENYDGPEDNYRFKIAYSRDAVIQDITESLEEMEETWK
jgi:hypothetical protein